MLKQDQAAELLVRCERLLGRRLGQLRGNLKKPATRAAAVWELLCIDAFARIGILDHEPPGDSSPDIVVRGVGTCPLWIEVAYLYPRFWENDRRARQLLMWLYQDATRLGIHATRISTRFLGDQNHPAGPIRYLPHVHEKSKILESGEWKAFAEAILAEPNAMRSVRLEPYSVIATYDPAANGPYIHSSGPVEEQPKTIEEHNLFRALKTKARQHEPDAPYMICVGSDQSAVIPHLGKPFGITEKDVTTEIFRRESGVSAVVVVDIATSLAPELKFQKLAHPRLYLNPRASRPVEGAQIDALRNVDFNRWRFFFDLEKWEQPDKKHFRQSGGDLIIRYEDGNISLTIPSTVLVDCLAGKTSMHTEYPDRPGESLLKCLDEGWQVVGCSYELGSIEQGRSSQVTLVLAPPPEPVYFDKHR